MPKKKNTSAASRFDLKPIEIESIKKEELKDKSVNLSTQEVEVSIKTETQPKKNALKKKGLKFNRLLTKPDVHPFDDMEWEKRDSRILDEKGNTVFELLDVEVPKDFSQLATDIAVSKYFRKAGVPETGHEVSFKQLVKRIAHTIRTEGEKIGGYFASEEDAQTFEMELSYLLVHQKAAFNSPVWFNCGLWHEYGIEGQGGAFYFDPETNQVETTKTAYEKPQCSACFIQKVEDDINSIFDLVKNEAILFKYGSGSGTNFSSVRGRGEKLGGGGTSSGLISFLEVLDRGAGSIKSGGTTRRAAKMVVLDIDHPEIVDFIQWKTKEEEKAKILIEYGGFPSDFNGEAYHTVSGQNSNNSVRVTDEFMNAYLENKDWHTTARTTGEIMETYKARELMDIIAQSAWHSADPGIQFDTTINAWHTCSNTDRIYASNPCSEYMFLDNSACNLASMNLLTFVKNGKFDVDEYRHATDIFTSAMDIIVSLAAYPTAPIAQNSYDYRPLGLGYANLGTLLMMQGIPYDSEEGRAWSGAISAILNSRAYARSAEIASVTGPFKGYAKNKEPMLNVIQKHRDAAFSIDPYKAPKELIQAAREDSDRMLELGKKYGFKNAQATVIAPTGTIGLLMDCDTTGIEPDFALVKFKKLAGGGFFKIVNQSVPQALKNLGYNEEETKNIIEYAIGTATLNGNTPINRTSLLEKGFSDSDIDKINQELKGAFDIEQAFTKRNISSATLSKIGASSEQMEDFSFKLLEHIGFNSEEINESSKVICGHMTVEGAPLLKDEHLAVFDCANKCGNEGTRFIDPLGHVKMMAAVQPFVSGAISKTVNLPNSATVKDIEDIYVQAWRLGVKAIAMYRDGSKSSQPLSSGTKKEKKKEADVVVETKIEYRPMRRRLPDERQAITHKFSIAGHRGFLTVGLYEDGMPGEIFITMNKEGSVISGLLDGFATSISYALQYGVPLRDLVNKFAHVRFEPSGFTKNQQIPIAKSIFDYIFRWMAIKFLPSKDWAAIGIHVDPEVLNNTSVLDKPADHQEPIVIDDEKQTTLDFKEATPQTNTMEKTQTEVASIENKPYDLMGDAPTCDTCGGMMTRSGTCYKCINCGSTSGCS
jgi:ribonucleoside-diphosphate reductase alpha chain